MKILLSVVALIFLSACSGEHKHDGRFVMDLEGVVYRLEHRIGDVYFVKPVDLTLLDEAKALKASHPLTTTE